MKQWKNLSDVMGLRREDIREVKRTVDEIKAEVVGMRAARLAPPPGQSNSSSRARRNSSGAEPSTAWENSTFSARLGSHP